MKAARNFHKWANKKVERFISGTWYILGTTYSMSWRYSSDQDRQVPCLHGASVLEEMISIRTNTNLKSKISAVYNIIPCGEIKTRNKAEEGDKEWKDFLRLLGQGGTDQSPAGILGSGRQKAEKGERMLGILEIMVSGNLTLPQTMAWQLPLISPTWWQPWFWD